MRFRRIYLENNVSDEFNDYMVQVRSVARDIGEPSIELAINGSLKQTKGGRDT